MAICNQIYFDEKYSKSQTNKGQICKQSVEKEYIHLLPNQQHLTYSECIQHYLFD